MHVRSSPLESQPIHSQSRSGGRAKVAERFIKYDWRKDIRELDRQLKREKDPFKRQVRYLMLMHAGFSDEWLDWQPDRALAQEVIEAIPPTSHLLSYWPYLILEAINTASKPRKHFGEPEQDLVEIQNAASPYSDYIYALSHKHPDSLLHSSFLSGAVELAFRQKQFEEFEQYYNEFMAA